METRQRQTRQQTKLTKPDKTVRESAADIAKKKRNVAAPKRVTTKTIVIDDDGPSSPVVTRIARGKDDSETLQMTYWDEDLCPPQMELFQRREQEYTELIKKLDTLSKQNGGGIIYKGDGCTAYQYNGSDQPFLQSNGSPTLETFTPTALTHIQPAPQQAKLTQPNSYQLVMDPRLGLIVGTMTPVKQPAAPAANTSGPAKASTSKRRTRGAAAAATVSQPPPLQALQQQFGSPSTSNTSITNFRPAENTAIGGLSTGTAKNASAIVDLTSDDGRPLADSREVAFNKLQGKTFPSLVVVARPHLHVKDTSLASDRAILDTKVKSVLVHTPTKFTEWLIQQGLVRSEQYCTTHPSNKLNLGMYSDVSKFPYSGGYVWISDCCPQRFVSVFSGSLFEGAAHPPSILLKLIYHWACQTNIQNIVQWVKVDNLYVKGLFTWLRAVCTYSLQQNFKLMGGPGKVIEVGVISLGTTSQDGSQRQVKVEVLGILDPELRLIRLRAVEPLADGERNYKRRFSKILEPLRAWVHPSSTIATDLTVDKGTLHFMGFTYVVQNTQAGLAGNQGVMEYLRKIVPRMFQNTLSLLSRQIIQQFLDELVWREWSGRTASQAFNNVIDCIAAQTRMNATDTLIQRLNKIAANPFKVQIFSLQPSLSSVSASTSTASTDSSAGTVKRYNRKRAASSVQPSVIIDLEKPKKIHLSDRSSPATANDNDNSNVPLESYYYGIHDGDLSNPLAQKVTLNVRCCVCKQLHSNNTRLLDHLLAHAHNMSAKSALTQCRYCLASLPNAQELRQHIEDSHPVETRTIGNSNPACIICEQRFGTVYMLGKHMSREHVPQELPYQCGTCGYRCSSHRQAVDHFYMKHDGATTLQCPFCLKSTSVWSSGRVMSTNVTFFLAHLQKHQKKSMARKCNKCALWFIQKDTLKEHQIKAHASALGKRGVRPYPLPSNYVMVPRSKIYPSNSSGPVTPPQLSPIEEQTIHNLTFIIPPSCVCKECHREIKDAVHFPEKQSCGSCRFITDCAQSMKLHKAKCQKAGPTGLQLSRFPLQKSLHCVCGYVSDCGNQIAKHLALCERKTAYPSAEQAKCAVDSNTHSMLDVLGLMRKNDDAPPAEAEAMDVDQLPEMVVQVEHNTEVEEKRLSNDKQLEETKKDDETQQQEQQNKDDEKTEDQRREEKQQEDQVEKGEKQQEEQLEKEDKQQEETEEEKQQEENESEKQKQGDEMEEQQQQEVEAEKQQEEEGQKRDDEVDQQQEEEEQQQDDEGEKQQEEEEEVQHKDDEVEKQQEVEEQQQDDEVEKQQEEEEQQQDDEVEKQQEEEEQQDDEVEKQQEEEEQQQDDEEDGDDEVEKQQEEDKQDDVNMEAESITEPMDES